MSESYKDKSELYRCYWGEGMTISETADELGATYKEVAYWLDKHGIPKRKPNVTVPIYIFGCRSRKWLFNEYWKGEKSTVEISRENDVSEKVVWDVMNDHNPKIRRRPRADARSMALEKKHASQIHYSNGYVFYNVGPKGETEPVREHRINAVGEWGLDAIKGNHVHHANGIKWLNVPEFDMDIPELESPNLQPIDPITHSKKQV